MSKRGSPTVVIVGPCASGKSTLAKNLVELGYDARISGQEHSEIATLWQHVDADIVIALHIDLETLRERRGASWSETLFQKQLRRLGHAYSAADLALDTVRLSEAQALDATIAYLESLS